MGQVHLVTQRRERVVSVLGSGSLPPILPPIHICKLMLGDSENGSSGVRSLVWGHLTAPERFRVCETGTLEGLW